MEKNLLRLIVGTDYLVSSIKYQVSSSKYQVARPGARKLNDNLILKFSRDIITIETHFQFPDTPILIPDT